MSVFYRTNKQGLIEAIDEDSGDVVSLQRRPEDIYTLKAKHMVKYKIDGREVYVDKSISLSDLPQLIDSTNTYDQVKGDLICERIMHGETISAICDDPAMPSYSAVCRWKRKHEDFAKNFEQAKKDRAERFHDKAVKVASDTDQDRVKFDALKWGAQVGNPAKYGPQTKVTGDTDAPVKIVVSTGIDRDNPPDIDVEEFKDCLPLLPKQSQNKSGEE